MIYYLGPQGSYSHEAALLIGQKPTPAETLKEVFLNSRQKKGIVPWENSLEGSVYETLDLLLTMDVKVVGEVNLAISHCLLGYLHQENAKKIVYSHPQAIGQCRDFIYQNRLEPISVSSTACGVLEAKKQKALAIGSLQAAKVYGIPVIKQGIQDRKDNWTRFAVLAKNPVDATGDDKTSIIFATENDRPGVLYRILAIFAEQGINLTRIESRPTKRYLGEYLFHIDFAGHVDEPQIAKVLENVRKQTAFLRILGSYPRWRG